MSVQSSTRPQPLPQPDGDPRPIEPGVPLGDYVRQRSAPVPVVVHRSGPAFETISVAERDRQLAALIEPMARMLYRAMQLHALGAVNDIAFDDLPRHIADRLKRDATIALNRQSDLYHVEAERKCTHEFTRLLDDIAFHFPHTAGFTTDPVERTRRERLAADLIKHIKSFSPEATVAEQRDRAFAEPLNVPARLQPIRTVFAGMVRS